MKDLISETVSVTISVTILMPREEISVLSSARREEIRRQLDEAERYRANPVLYIFNPHIRVSIIIMLLLMMIMMINTAVADILQITTQQHPVIIETTAVGFLRLPSNIFFPKHISTGQFSMYLKKTLISIFDINLTNPFCSRNGFPGSS